MKFVKLITLVVLVGVSLLSTPTDAVLFGGVKRRSKRRQERRQNRQERRQDRREIVVGFLNNLWCKALIGERCGGVGLGACWRALVDGIGEKIAALRAAIKEGACGLCEQEQSELDDLLRYESLSQDDVEELMEEVGYAAEAEEMEFDVQDATDVDAGYASRWNFPILGKGLKLLQTLREKRLAFRAKIRAALRNAWCRFIIGERCGGKGPGACWRAFVAAVRAKIAELLPKCNAGTCSRDEGYLLGDLENLSDCTEEDFTDLYEEITAYSAQEEVMQFDNQNAFTGGAQYSDGMIRFTSSDLLVIGLILANIITVSIAVYLCSSRASNKRMKYNVVDTVATSDDEAVPLH